MDLLTGSSETYIQDALCVAIPCSCSVAILMILNIYVWNFPIFVRPEVTQLRA